MVIKNILMSVFLVVLFLPLAFATENVDEIFAIDSVAQIVENDEFSSCSNDARDVCLMFSDLGLVVGNGIPYVLPKNGVLNLQFNNGSAIGNAVLESGKISEINCCVLRDDFTHTVSVSSLAVVEEIKSADDLFIVANDKLSSGDIVISANSFKDKARLSVAKTILKVKSWFK